MKIQFISLLCLAGIMALSACGKKATVAESEAEKVQGGEAVVDITRPPKLVIEKTDEETELNPEETVSFDKWQKQQAVDD